MSAINERNLKFETLQLHVGQETADSVTDSKSRSYLSDIIIRFPQLTACR